MIEITPFSAERAAILRSNTAIDRVFDFGVDKNSEEAKVSPYKKTVKTIVLTAKSATHHEKMGFHLKCTILNRNWLNQHFQLVLMQTFLITAIVKNFVMPKALDIWTPISQKCDEILYFSDYEKHSVFYFKNDDFWWKLTLFGQHLTLRMFLDQFWQLLWNFKWQFKKIRIV